MEYTLEQKYELIKQAALKATSKDPVEIALSVMEKDFINIHGPEHHFLDGAAFLAAYRNAGGELNLEVCLDELAKRTITMPGAMCGYWGICGSVASVGAAFSVIHGTSPLSTDGYYKDNMEYTSSVINRMAEIGGARCCKWNAFLALSYAAAFVKDKYGIPMECAKIHCDFSPKNAQCLGNKCPFHSLPPSTRE